MSALRSPDRTPPHLDRDEEGADTDRRPPLGDVLGPLPLCSFALVVGALVGDHLTTWLAGDAAGSPATVAFSVFVVALTANLHLLVTGVRACRRAGDRPDEAAIGWHRIGAGEAVWAPGRARVGLLAVVVVATVGMATAAVRTATGEYGLLPRLAAEGGSVPVVATVVHEPRPTATGWHVLVRVDEVAGLRTRERAAVSVEADPPPLGQRWQARASARPIPDGGYGRWLARQHATVVLDADRWERVGRPGTLSRASEHARERVRTAATAHLPDDVGGLLTGFVTGDTRRLPDDEADAMKATGLTHLTAVSGTHTAILAAGVVGGCGLLGVGARGRRRALLTTLVAFAFLTRFQPSVLRAATMGAVVLLAGARGVPRDPRHALAGAVLVLVLVDPMLAGSLGLLLSACAAAGVLVLAPIVRDRLHRLPRRLAEVTGVTVGAQLAVVPLLVLTFGEVPLASVPANVLAVPPASVAIAGAFVAGVVAQVAPGPAGWLFAVAGVPARAVLWAAHAFDDVGWIASTARPVTLLLLGLGAVWLLTPPRRRRFRRTVAVVTAVAVVGAAGPLIGGRLPVRTLAVTAIDVGQGDAFLVESPGARVLVDAGEDATAARWLRSTGRRHLDLLIVTHGHLDHVGGAAQVVRTARVDAVWYRPVPTDLPLPRDRSAAANGSAPTDLPVPTDPPAVAELLAVADDRGVPVRAPVSGDRARVGDLHLEVLSPPPGRPYRWSRSELNDSSLVVLVTWADRRVLLTGDAERAAQQDLLALPERLGRPDLLEVEVLAVPHHGSATTDPAFLRAVRPQVGLIGVGADNRHGHPHPDVLAVLEELGVEVRRTDLEGTVRVEVPAPARVARPASPGARHPPRAAPRASPPHRRLRAAPARTHAPSCRRRPVGSAHAARAPPRR